MFSQTFYHGLLRKYVILFGTLFDDIWIVRKDADGNPTTSLKVPLSYGPREKFLARIEGMDAGLDPLEQPFAVVLPRMGFEISSFSYAAERKLPTINKFTRATASVSRDAFYYNPVPYDINFTLSVFVKSVEDGTQVIEQILPYFTPEFTTTVQLVDDPDITLDIPLILTGTSQDDVYEGSFEERRALIFNLEFTMKGVFFGPKREKGIIKLANTSLTDASRFDDIESAFSEQKTVDIRVYPGQDANGFPTSDPTLAVDPTTVESNSDFFYIVEKTNNGE